MLALIITILLTYLAPLALVVTIPFFIIGLWLISLGITQRTKPYELLTTAPSAYVLYGGLMVTASVTYLAYITTSSNIILPLALLLLGVTLTIIFSYYIGRVRKVK
jgi:hypothetical protein